MHHAGVLEKIKPEEMLKVMRAIETMSGVNLVEFARKNEPKSYQQASQLASIWSRVADLSDRLDERLLDLEEAGSGRQIAINWENPYDADTDINTDTDTESDNQS